MKRKLQLLFTVLAVVVVVAFMFRQEAPTTTEVTDTSTTVEAAETASGYSVAIDPTTRKFVEPATATDVKTQVDPLSRSSKGLVEESAPGGGMMVNLQGRFQHRQVATINTDGNVAVECDADDNTNSEEE